MELPTARRLRLVKWISARFAADWRLIGCRVGGCIVSDGTFSGKAAKACKTDFGTVGGTVGGCIVSDGTSSGTAAKARKVDFGAVGG